MSSLGYRWGVLGWERGKCPACGSNLTNCCIKGKRLTLRWYNAAKRLHVLGWLGGKCEVCGIDDPVMLEIAHQEPMKRQKWGINVASAVIAYKLGELEAVKFFKCLCANHHRTETYLRGEWRSVKW